MDIDCRISARAFSQSHRTIYPDAFPCKTLSDAVRYILSNNSFQGSNATLTVHQEDVFEVIEQLKVCPSKMFESLRTYFAKFFDIDLYIIGFINEKFSIIHDDKHDKANMAYLQFNKDHTIYGPLYITSVNGNNETVFSKDAGIHVDICIYVVHLNDIKPSTDILQIQEQQAVHCMEESIEGLSIDNTLDPTNQINLSDSVQIDAKIQSRILLDRILSQVFRLIDGLPIDAHIMNEVWQQFVPNITPYNHLFHEEAITILKQYVMSCSNLIQIAEQSMNTYQSIQVDTLQSTLPSHLSNQTIEINSIHSNNIPINLQYQMNQIPFDIKILLNTSVSKTYDQPTLIKQLKSSFHPRNLKEFAKTKSSPIQCINSKQRDPFQIRVPPDDGNLLCLAIELHNPDGQIHPSKVIVPDKTKAKDESLINNNDLRCLKFDECQSDDQVDLDNKRIYLKITKTERQALVKDIRIHIINLYQRRGIDRKMVQNQDLKKCKLAFCFCTLENTKYKHVSPVNYSNIMEECNPHTNKQKNITNKQSKRFVCPTYTTDVSL
ncbi:unnamed protein product [Rotaria sordida]|uniref:Uncharacterized protein n=1 Tax=Rotaria sordida TaxID=392033 RepID=A0A814TBX1_9BILA|nr:unnamed protein product [Rotaria sordida]